MGLWDDIKKHALILAERLFPAPCTRFTVPLGDWPVPRPGPLPEVLPEVAIVTPCKDSAGYIRHYFSLIDALDYPKDRVHLFVLEGDSTDDTYGAITQELAAREGKYASAVPLKLDLGANFGNTARQAISVQRRRRAAIAACRNALLKTAMQTKAAFVLCIDADMGVIPPDSLKRLMGFGAPILMANCRNHDRDSAFDLNAFRYLRPVSDRLAKAYVRDEIYQPPGGFFRHYPGIGGPDDIEVLHSVGGTCLLIRRDVLEAGVDFPVKPYQLHIETEGLALKAAMQGFGSFMATGVITRHSPR